MPHNTLPIPPPRDLLRLAMEKAGGIMPPNDREMAEMSPDVVCEALRELIAARTKAVDDGGEKVKKRR